MPDGFKLGSAFITVDPDAKDFKPKLQEILEKDKFTVKVKVEPDAKDFKSKLDTALAKDRSTVKVKAEVDAAGLKDKLQADLNKGRSNTVQVKAEVDAKGLKDKLQADLAKGRNPEIDVKAKVDAAGLKERLEADLHKGRQPGINVKANLDAKDFGARLDALARNRTVKIKVDVDRSNLNKIMNDAGKAGGEAFGSGFGGAGAGGAGGGGGGIGAVGGVGIAGLVVGALAVLPELMVGLGAASGVALGTALVFELNKNNKAFQASFSKLGDTAKSVLKEAVEPMVVPLEKAFGQIGSWITKLKPELTTLFSAAAKDIMPLVKGVEMLVQNFLPGFNAMMKASGPAVQALAQGMALLGKYLGETFKDLLPGIKGSSQAFIGLIKMLGQMVTGIAKVASGIASGAGATIGKFFSDFGKLFTNVLMDVVPTINSLANNLLPIVMRAARGLEPLVKALGSALPGVIKALSPLLDGLVKAITPLIPVIAKVGSALIDDLVKAFSPLIKAITSLLPFVSKLMIIIGNGLMQAIVQIAPVLIELGKELSKVAMAVLPPLLSVLLKVEPVFMKMFLTLAKSLTPSLMQLIPALGNLLISLAPLITTLAKIIAIADVFVITIESKVIANAIAPMIKWISQLITWIAQGITWFIKWAGKISDWAGFWKAAWTDTQNWWDNIERTIAHTADLIYNHIFGWINDVRKTISGAWDNVYRDTDAIWGKISNFFHQAWANIINYFSQVLTNIKNNVSDTWRWIQNTFGSALDWVKNTWSDAWRWVWNYINQIFTNIKNDLGAVWHWIESTFTSGVNTVKNIWHEGIGWINTFGNSVWNTLKSDIGSVWTWIKNAFSQGVKDIQGIWNGIEGVLKAPMHWFVNTVYNGGIVKVVDAIAGVFHQSPLKPITGFAKGTEGAPAGWAWVGEEGPELINLRGGEEILPHPQSMATGLWDGGRLPGFAKGTSGGSGGGPGGQVKNPAPGSPASAAQEIDKATQQTQSKAALGSDGLVGAPVVHVLKGLLGKAIGLGVHKIIDPLLNDVTGQFPSTFGPMLKQAVESPIDGVIKWLETESAANQSSGSEEDALEFMLKQVGKKYSQAARYGPDSWDCSGLVWYASHQAGIGMPGGPGADNAAAIVDPELQWVGDQSGASVITDPKKVQRGDYIGFHASDQGTFGSAKMNGDHLKIGKENILTMGHIGMVVDGSKYVSAYDTQEGVIISPISGDQFGVAVRLKGGGGSGSLTGDSKTDDDRGKQVIDFLASNLFSGNYTAAGGAAASMGGESNPPGWNPESVGTGGWGLYGLSEPFAGVPGQSESQTGDIQKDMATQLKGLLTFVHGSGDDGAISEMMSADNIADAANIWGPKVERFGINDVHQFMIDRVEGLLNAMGHKVTGGKASDGTKPGGSDPSVTKPTKTGVSVAQQKALAKLGGFAGGTDYAPPGWAWVGERGRELVHMVGGETVLDANSSRNFSNMSVGGFAAGTASGDLVAKHYMERIADYQEKEDTARKAASRKGLTKTQRQNFEAQVDTYKKDIARLNEDLQAHTTSKQQAAAKAEVAAEKAKEKAKEAAAKRAATLLKSEQDRGLGIIDTLGTQVEKGMPSISNVGSDLNAALKAITKYYNGAQAKNLEQILIGQSQKMDKIVTRYDSIASTVKAAQTYAAGVKSNLSGYAGISGLTNSAGTAVVPTTGTGVGLGSTVVIALRYKLKSLETFNNLIKQANKKGINKSFLQQAIDLGPDGGTQYLQAILAGGNPIIKQLNDVQSQINKSTSLISTNAGNLLYDPASMGKSLAAGLLSQENALDKEFAKLASKFAVNLAHDLRIPTKELPHFASGGSFAAGTVAVVGERGEEVVKFNQAGTVYPHGSNPGNGATITVNVNGYSGDPEMIAQAVYAKQLVFAQRGAMPPASMVRM